MTTQRSTFASRIGFILTAAGSAVGLGAIWKFPYMTGNNGGGAFLFLYIAALLGIGLAMMLAELALGRNTRLGALGAFRKVGGPVGSIFGYSNLLACVCIISFYCVVGGWTVGYLVKAVTGVLLSPPGGDFKAQFETFAADGTSSLIYLVLFTALSVVASMGGVQKGIERVSKTLMPVLFVLMLVMIVRSLTLPGAMKGVSFFLIPDFSKMTGTVLVQALGFACFSLSLGFGCMITYGSYMGKDDNMVRSAIWVIALQALCSVLAGFAVLPAVFAFDMPPGQGPGLSYITLPAVFTTMPGGSIFAVVFFSLLLVAALTSSISIVETLVAFLVDEHKFSRVAAGVTVAAVTCVLGVLPAWSFGAADVPELFGKNPFDLADALSSNVMLPLNVLATCLLMGWLKFSVFRNEIGASPREEAQVESRMGILYTYICIACRFIAPTAIVAILIAGLL